MGMFFGYTNPDGTNHYLALIDLERAQDFLKNYLNKIPSEVRQNYVGVRIFSYPLHFNENVGDFLHPKTRVPLEHALRPRANLKIIEADFQKLSQQFLNKSWTTTSEGEITAEVNRLLGKYFAEGWLRTGIVPILQRHRNNLRILFQIKEPAITYICQVEIQ